MTVAAAKPRDGAAFTTEFAGVLHTFDDLAQAHADTAKRSNDTLALETARQELTKWKEFLGQNDLPLAGGLLKSEMPSLPDQ